VYGDGGYQQDGRLKPIVKHHYLSPFKGIVNVPKVAFFAFLERNHSPICDGLSLH
jgi:hypothetical protein